MEFNEFFSKDILILYTNSILTLKEEGKTKQCINTEGKSLTVLKLDAYNNVWFKEHVKMCDYAILYKTNKKLNITLIELKSKNYSSAYKQLECGELLCDYFMKVYYNKYNLIKEIKYQTTKILFYKPKKQFQRTIKSKLYSIRKIKYSRDTINFSKLI